MLAKQDGADAELQAVCTQGLNLFRVLATALKPVLPRTTGASEAFLDAPVTRWNDVVAPLLAHRIKPYTPLFTRIDPKHIEHMIDSSKDTLAPATAAPAPTVATTDETAPVTAATAPQIGIDDFAKLDLRIGSAGCASSKGPTSCCAFAGGRGPRPSASLSGIRASYIETDQTHGRKVCVPANRRSADALWL